MTDPSATLADDARRAHLAAIVESSDDAILSKRLDGTITSWNAGAERMYGYTTEEVVGQPVSMLVPDDQSDEIPAIMSRLRRGERVDHYQTVRRAKDGRLLDVSLTISPIKDRQGRIIGASAVARDISERKRAEQVLARVTTEAEQRKRLYETIMSNTPDLVFVFDLNHRVTYANEALLTMWGLDWDEARGKSFLEVGYEPWLADRHTRELEEVAATKQPVRGEVPFPHSQLGERIYDYIMVPILGSDGEVEAFAGTTRDVTEPRRVEQSLRQLNETLEQRVADRTAESRQRADQLQKLAGELSDVEHRERRRLAQLLHDDLQQILVAAKIRLTASDGAGTVHAEAVEEADQLLEQAINTSRSLTTELAPPVLYDLGLNRALEWLARWVDENYGLRVDVDTDHSEPVESEQLRVLVFNAVRELLLNVVKHASVCEARIVLKRRGGRLHVTVEDLGAGFDPVARRVEAGSSGYGLFSIQERLELMGGSATIDSAPTKGTRVSIVTPLTPARPERDEPAVAKPASSRQAVVGSNGPAVQQDGERCIGVLLTDDHDLVRRGLANLIKQEPGMQIVAEAASGEEAVELARQHRPEVVVMDISLPGISGIEATQRIVAANPEACVIGLSIHEERDVAEAMRLAGGKAYFNKREVAEKLVQSIRSFCDAAVRRDRA